MLFKLFADILLAASVEQVTLPPAKQVETTDIQAQMAYTKKEFAYVGIQ